MTKRIQLTLLAVISAALAISAQAQNDLVIGFTAGNGSGNDLIYDLGANPTSFTNGQTWNLSTLLAGFTLSSVQWGVLGDDNNTTAWSSSAVGVPPHKIANAGALTSVDTAISGIEAGFTGIGPNGFGAGDYFYIAASGQGSSDNSWYSQTINPSLFTQYKNVNGVPSPNVTGTVSDSFYQLLANNSAPTLLGSFSLSSGGILTFNLPSNSPPTPRIIAITRTNSVSTISFTTTNGTFTYTLRYTNSAGLTTSVTNWPASPTTLIGNGNTNSLTDTTADPIRFYRIGVH